MMLFLIFLILVVLFLLLFLILLKITFLHNKKDDNIYNIPSIEDYQKQKDYFINLIDEFDKIKYEDVYVESFDGLKLHGRYYHCSDSSPVAICFHGYRGTAVRDFCGIIKTCFKLKQNVLVIDQRAHGLSEGKIITFGIKERFDVLSWTEYVNKRFPKCKILLYGISMGASTILMASSLKLPKNVVGIVADSPYDKPSNIIKKIINDLHLSSKIIYPSVYLTALIYGHFNLNDASAVDSVQHTKMPILLVHGKKDTIVPYQMSENIYKNAKSCEKLFLVESAEHGISYILDEKKYVQEIKNFIKKIGL